MHCTSTPHYTLTVWWLMKHWDSFTLWSVFMLLSCVAHRTNCHVNNKRWITISNNVLVHKQQWQNVIPVDEESCGCCVRITPSGTSVTSDWGRSWGKTAVLSAVVQCSLEDSTITNEPTALIVCPNGRKCFCETLMLSYQIARRHIQEDSDVDENITWDPGSLPPCWHIFHKGL